MYLSSRHAASLHHQDVAGTEWPMFGAVFYLVTAEELHRRGAIDATRGRVRQAVDRAVEIVASPDTATWVITKWGPSYLERENVFYRMLLIMGFAAYDSMTGDQRYQATMTEQRTSLARELMAAPFHVLDDYPGECYPNDVLWAVAAIQRASRLSGTNSDDLVAAIMTAMNGPLKAQEGMPAFQVDARSGALLQGARGCGNSGILPFAAELDVDKAVKWYRAYEKGFWKDTGWAVGFTEEPHGTAQDFMDVDSGPVVFGFGSVASAFGIGAAKSVGRFDHAAPLTMEAVAAAWPTPFGMILPGAMGYLAADSWSLGEVALLYTMTRPVFTEETVPFTGRTPLMVWLLFIVYAGLGILVIRARIRFLIAACRKTPGT